MISRRTFIIALLIICVIDMIQAGVLDDIGEALHYDDVKKFTKNAAAKTGEAATNAFDSAKNFFSKIGGDSTNPSSSSVTKS